MYCALRKQSGMCPTCQAGCLSICLHTRDPRIPTVYGGQTRSLSPNAASSLRMHWPLRRQTKTLRPLASYSNMSRAERNRKHDIVVETMYLLYRATEILRFSALKIFTQNWQWRAESGLSSRLTDFAKIYAEFESFLFPPTHVTT
jgi:hypothetical protein